jgi:glutaredoxin-related protein
MQTFYHGLFTSTRESVDAAARGAFLSLNLTDATALIEKMASNQSWNEEHVQPSKRGGMHQLKEADMVSAKLDLIMKKLEARDTMKKEVMHINDSRMTYEEYRDIGHLGVNCLEFQEDVNYINNNNSYRPQQNQWNQQQRPNYQVNYLGNF